MKDVQVLPPSWWKKVDSFIGRISREIELASESCSASGVDFSLSWWKNTADALDRILESADGMETSDNEDMILGNITMLSCIAHGLLEKAV